MSHTPGPWAWRWKSGSLHQVGTDKPYGAVILFPTYEYDSGVDIDVSEANARLIAAAPDLLAALKWFIDDLTRPHTVMLDFDTNVARARAAIARSEGATP